MTVTAFLVPTFIVHIYGEIAHFGAGVFLLVQLVSVISFITWLNDCCQSDKISEKCRIHVMSLATAAYVICIVGIIMMYVWYAPEPSCLLNIFFITWKLVNIGYLTPGLMGLYVVFICCEPAGEICIRKTEESNRTDWLTIISFVIALLAMVIATFSTGIDSQCFQLCSAKLVKWTINVGWTSTWVRIVNEWLAVCVYRNVDAAGSFDTIENHLAPMFAAVLSVCHPHLLNASM
ncbi:Serinc-domain containing serine and sphingolipid biosynthesis protein isoform 2 [Hibiscus syriacus]|uniref:Serinc-domain containing serine and sphingolipid biosynthesis protein isoform 2 n=1 Tax=Hibiscus syriacus TaxID=106335 RepID=A0A6A2YD85_HIBSY|nr:Serinc-domain containing serine and sphingolipid biosynthesis protein isoform 2 [Hibiscus syriacus]